MDPVDALVARYSERIAEAVPEGATSVSGSSLLGQWEATTWTSSCSSPTSVTRPAACVRFIRRCTKTNGVRIGPHSASRGRPRSTSSSPDRGQTGCTSSPCVAAHPRGRRAEGRVRGPKGSGNGRSSEGGLLRAGGAHARRAGSLAGPMKGSDPANKACRIRHESRASRPQPLEPPSSSPRRRKGV